MKNENGGLHIDEVFAFISVDENGDEGVIAVKGHDGSYLPLIGADMERIDSLRHIAAHTGEANNMTVKLIKLSVREELETYNGEWIPL